MALHAFRACDGARAECTVYPIPYLGFVFRFRSEDYPENRSPAEPLCVCMVGRQRTGRPVVPAAAYKQGDGAARTADVTVRIQHDSRLMYKCCPHAAILADRIARKRGPMHAGYKTGAGNLSPASPFPWFRGW